MFELIINLFENNKLLFLTIICFIMVLFFYFQKKLSKKQKWLISILFIIQGLAIIVLPNKANFIIGILLILIGLFYYEKNKPEFNKTISNEDKELSPLLNIISFRGVILPYFPLIGISFALIDITSNYLFFNGYIGRSDSLILLFCFSMIAYPHIPNIYKYERDFFISFAFFLNLLLVFPLLAYGIISGDNLSYNNQGFFEEFVPILLTYPLSNLLNILGYSVFVDGQYLYFFDLTTDKMVNVWIARGCSGIYSVVIFVSAFLSFLSLEYKKMGGVLSFLLLSLGIMIAYLANLARMAIIILVGHYYGSEALVWTHENAGWAIFFVWVAIFWAFSFKIVEITKD